jgi:hypothetical protein
MATLAAVYPTAALPSNIPVKTKHHYPPIKNVKTLLDFLCFLKKLKHCRYVSDKQVCAVNNEPCAQYFSKVWLYLDYL